MVQRINSSAFVFSASLPVPLTAAASAALTVLQRDSEIFDTLAANVRAFRAVLDPLCVPGSSPSSAALIAIPSADTSPLVHVQLGGPFPADAAGIEAEERLLQAVVDEALAHGAVLITRATRLRDQEVFALRPSLKIAISAALTRKEVEKSAVAVRSALVKVLGRR